MFMKKYIVLLIFIIAIITLTGCPSNTRPTGGSTTGGTTQSNKQSPKQDTTEIKQK